ncbi:amidohydrolase family protein [Nonomuraea sp. NPDC004702]
MTKQTLIEDVRIFDGERVTGTGGVLIDGAEIAHVAPRIPRRPGWEIVPGDGRTLLPGLIDAHTHAATAEHLRKALVQGTTTCLNMFSYPLAELAALREAAASRDDVAGLRSSGILASVPGGLPDVPGLPKVSGPEEAEAFVAARAAEGSDYIKIVLADPATPALAPETVRALVTAAARRGLLTVAHAPRHAAAQVALDAGVDMITHAPLDTPLTPAFARTMAGAGRTAVPTLTMMRRMADTYGLSYEAARDSVGALHQAGVPILAGTDANEGGGPALVPFGEAMHDELALLVEAGLTETQALAAATSLPARHFGLRDRGRIAPGARADLLLVDGDPTAAITATRDLAGVWRRGVRVRT